MRDLFLQLRLDVQANRRVFGFRCPHFYYYQAPFPVFRRDHGLVDDIVNNLAFEPSSDRDGAVLLPWGFLPVLFFHIIDQFCWDVLYYLLRNCSAVKGHWALKDPIRQRPWLLEHFTLNEDCLFDPVFNRRVELPRCCSGLHWVFRLPCRSFCLKFFF